MPSLIIVVAILLVLRLFVLQRASQEHKSWLQLFRNAVWLESRDWLITILLLILFFVLLYSVALYFGPYPPIHEWFN